MSHFLIRFVSSPFWLISSCLIFQPSIRHDKHIDNTAVATLLGRKYHRLGHEFLCSIYETKNDFGKNMT